MSGLTTMPRSRASTPTAFISYSWDGDDHKVWVRSFAARLRGDGVDVTLDQWHAVPGDQLPEFMERAITRNRYVLIICTKHYKERADKRVGGVGYEGDIMTAEVFSTKSRQKQRKFIPILRAGSWKQSAPSWLQGKYRIHLDSDPYLEEQYQDLLATLHNARPKPPPLGPRPEKYRIQELRKYLKSSAVDERLLAVIGLTKIGPPGGSRSLVAALRDDDKKVRLETAKALSGIGPAAESAVPALVAALREDDEWMRQAAVIALTKIGPAAVPALATTLRDDAWVRRLALVALNGIGRAAEAAVPALVAALEDDDKWVRQGAAAALEKIGPAAESAVPALIAALKDDDEGVLGSAVLALGKIGPAAKSAVPALIAALKLGEQLSICLALTKIGSAAVPALLAALSDDDEEARKWVVLTLGEIGPAAEPAIPALVAELKDEDEEVRRSAILALGRIGPAAEPAIPALVAALKDEDEEVRRSVVLALGRIGSVAESVVSALIAALKDDDGEVREMAASALARIGPA